MSTDSKFATRSLTASEYVRKLFGPEDNAAILVRNRSTGHTVQTIAEAETIATPDFQSWLAGQSASGYDVFVGMNPIKDGAFSRTKGDIKDIRHVYLDLDRKGDEALQAIRNSSEVPAPNFVLDTSPGKHQVVWKVSGFSQDEAESLLHNLANKFGGDLAATDSTRALRLPGFANHKLPEQFIVQARQESDAVYTLHDFTIDEDSPETPRHLADAQERRRTVPSNHKSQSEHDWAYAKRALARGDDPEVVIQRIADYRAADKDDPNYYARRTVTKARAELKSSTAPQIPESPAGEESSQDRIDLADNIPKPNDFSLGRL
jgi:DNA primase RepB-like protein